MNVMCVKKIILRGHGVGWNDVVPVVGDEDVVIDTFLEGGHTYYSLQRFGLEKGFLTSFFSVLPDGDADEIDAVDKEAIVPNPNAHVHPIMLSFLKPYIK
jgi:hypothetical protein